MTIHVEEAGKGNKESIIMVHGAGGSVATWFMQIRGLPDKLHTLAIDLNGHGKTIDKNQDPSISYLTDIDMIVSDYEKPILMGHSMGGALTQLYALKHPERLGGIILVGTGAKLRVAPIIFELLKNDFEGYLQAMAEYAFHPNTSKEMIDSSINEMRKCKIPIIHRDFKFCDSFNIMDRIQDISLPVLIIVGEGDRLTPPKYSQYLHDGITESELVILQHAGHSVMLEQATRFNEVAIQWIENLGN